VGILSARPKGQRAGVLGSPPARGLGSAVSSPSGVQGGAPEKFNLVHFASVMELNVPMKFSFYERV